MTWLREHRQRLAFWLSAVALVATCAATALGGVRLHDAAVVERQALRTQTLASAVFRVEDFPSSQQVLANARAAFATVASHDADQGVRLSGTFEAFIRNHSDSNLSRFESLLDVESTRLAAETNHANHRARFALIAAVIWAGLLVVLLLYQFELARRAGRIDRDNARRSAELVRLRGEFVAVVSHELRTPLTSIIGYLELIKRGTDQASYLEVVERNAFRLASLVDDLLFAAAAEDGGLTLERQNVAIDALADQAVDAARPGADAKRILLSRTGEAGAFVSGDARRLAQALDNLVSKPSSSLPKVVASRFAPQLPTGECSSRWPTPAKGSRPTTGRTCSSRSSGARKRTRARFRGQVSG